MVTMFNAQSVVPSHQQGLPEKFLLEADHYTNPKWQEVEQRQIFRCTWLYVGDAEKLCEPGMVWATTVAGINLLITRDHSEELSAFHNVCPHRAAVLAPAVGVKSCKKLVCPYHAWAYDLAGNLVGVPSQEKFGAGFQKKDFGLYPIRLETWSGFIFVCLDEKAPSLDDFLGSIPKNLGTHRMTDSRQLFCKQYQVACNWKNYHDNTLCDYHVAIAHRTTLNQVQGPIRQYRHQLEPYVNLLYTPTTEAWQTANHILPHLTGPSREGFFTYGIYPNLHLLGLPNGLLAWIRIEPLAVDRCQVTLDVYGDSALTPAPDVLQTEFEAFMQEDMELTESVQLGYASGVYQRGPVNGLETRIIHQQELIHSAIFANKK